MRSVAFAALMLALAGCGGGNADELGGTGDELNAAQIEAALGPADQSAIEDAIDSNAISNADGADPNAVVANEPATAEAEDQQENR